MEKEKSQIGRAGALIVLSTCDNCAVDAAMARQYTRGVHPVCLKQTLQTV